MKKLFSRKVVGILIVAAIILGSTAALGYAMVSAQAAANAALDSQPIAQLEAPLPTPRPPSVFPQPKDLTKEAAIDIAINEMKRVFGEDASQGDVTAGFDSAQEYLASSNGRSAWYINIVTPEYFYTCELDSVTGEIAVMRRENQLLPVLQPGLAEHYRLLPGESYYEIVIREAFKIITPDVVITDVRFLRSLYNTGERLKFNFIVTLENGSAYSIILDKENYEFLGYSVWNSPINESLFEDAPDTKYIDIVPSVTP